MYLPITNIACNVYCSISDYFKYLLNWGYTKSTVIGNDNYNINFSSYCGYFVSHCSFNIILCGCTCVVLCVVTLCKLAEHMVSHVHHTKLINSNDSWHLTDHQSNHQCVTSLQSPSISIFTITHTLYIPSNWLLHQFYPLNRI